MNVQIMSTPCYLLETVELIYAFVNGVPAEARKSIFKLRELCYTEGHGQDNTNRLL